MTQWTIPDWPEPFDPGYEVPHLKALALEISSRFPAIECLPNFSVEGCAFVTFHKAGILIGRACVAEHDSGDPFFSAYFGSDTDEFHGFQRESIIQLAAIYETRLPIE